METIKVCVKGTISPKSKGIRTLQEELDDFKKVLIPRVQKAVRRVVKDRSITVYGQQKWMLDRKITKYIQNLPFHPMAFHRQSVWLEEKGERFYIHLKTKQEGKEAVCPLEIKRKYLKNWSEIEKACGLDNPILGQVELIEDNKYGWINCHIVLRLPKPEPYKPKGWLGVDVGWNKLATSILASSNPHLKFYNPTVHCKNFKTQIIQLKYLQKQYARKGRSWKKWDFRLKNTVKYAVGVAAKEIVSKAKSNKAGVALEDLTFQSQTKRWLIPRYKLMVAVKTLCERQGVPFKLVPAQYTSMLCPKCGNRESEKLAEKRGKSKKEREKIFLERIGQNRNRTRFKCIDCGYQADADITAAMNIAAIALGLAPKAKEATGLPAVSGHVARPLSTEADDLKIGWCKPEGSGGEVKKEG
jgi:transposase